MLKKILFVLAALAWGMSSSPAIAQSCGSARDTDLDGSYVSSTSTDRCGGHAILQSLNKQPTSTLAAEKANVSAQLEWTPVHHLLSDWQKDEMVDGNAVVAKTVQDNQPIATAKGYESGGQ